MIVDFHTHAFPDRLAARAVSELAQLAGTPSVLDGTVAGLLSSMDRAGIDTAVVASIATKPQQFQAILDWSRQIASDRIVPFASLYPLDPQALSHVAAIAAAGLRGIKLHPYYQDFDLDDPRLEPLYAALRAAGLVVLIHAGFDLAFPRVRRCEPARVRRVLDHFPGLILVASHFGGWQEWDDVERYLIGQPVYLDTSYVGGYLDSGRARAMMLAHPAEYLLFGSDSPWQEQASSLNWVRSLGLDPDREERLLGTNAEQLLGPPRSSTVQTADPLASQRRH